MSKDNTLIIVVVAVILVIVMFISTIRGFITIANARKNIESNDISVNEYEEDENNYEKNIVKNIINNMDE